MKKKPALKVHHTVQREQLIHGLRRKDLLEHNNAPLRNA